MRRIYRGKQVDRVDGRSRVVWRSWLCIAMLMSAGCQKQSGHKAEVRHGGEVKQAVAKDSVGSEPLTVGQVRAAMDRVAAWQYAQYDAKTNLFNDDESADGHPQGWAYAALHTGLVAHARVVNTKEAWERLRGIAQRGHWGFAPRVHNADDYAIGHLYMALSQRYSDSSYLGTTQRRLQQILAKPATVELAFAHTGKKEILDDREWGVVPCKNRWCWCDALFMGPPVWMQLGAVTGDARFVAFADKEFWATVDFLYDSKEHLFYRDSRYFDRREKNGAKVFWGRGNGWVIAGFARTLQFLPADHPHRGRYFHVFREVAKRLAGLQTDQGYWRSSLLLPRPEENPETSGTGLIVFALAWGVQNGILERATYLPVIERGWRGLLKAVHPDGKLGWVQQVASEPGSATYDDSQLYGVGAFLMAGAEIIALLSQHTH